MVFFRVFWVLLWMFFWFGFYFWIFCCFGVFGVSGFLIFWCFFDVFLIFLRFFFLAFALLLLTKMGTIFKILLQFFFFGVYCPALMRWCCKHHRLEFTASSLVFNRICKSIKKYKTAALWFFKASTFTGCNLIFLGSTLYSLRFELMSLPCNL